MAACGTNVRLSINEKPRFPSRCVVCGEDAPPRSRAGLSDLRIGRLSMLTSSVPENWDRVEVPVHDRCCRPAKTRRWLVRVTSFVAAVTLVVLFGDTVSGMLPSSLERFGEVLLLLAVVVPILALDALFPPRFDVSFSKYHVDYGFADPEYAVEFARENKEFERARAIKVELMSD